MRMAGQALKPMVNTGKGCATKPETFPAKPTGGSSHGPQLLGQKYVSQAKGSRIFSEEKSSRQGQMRL